MREKREKVGDRVPCAEAISLSAKKSNSSLPLAKNPLCNNVLLSSPHSYLKIAKNIKIQGEKRRKNETFNH